LFRISSYLTRIPASDKICWALLEGIDSFMPKSSGVTLSPGGSLR